MQFTLSHHKSTSLPVASVPSTALSAVHHSSNRKGRTWRSSRVSSPSRDMWRPAHAIQSGSMPHASSFRLASTRHYFDGRTQQWKDLPTTWITVKAYRGLSESICQSFKKGEPVIVTGVLAAESWVDQNGKQQSKLVMEANAAGA